MEYCRRRLGASVGAAAYEVAFEDDELLVALERFEGVLIASTNLFDEHHIEPAALRRFDLIVQMRSATPEQLMELLRRCARELGLGAPSDPDFQPVRT